MLPVPRELEGSRVIECAVLDRAHGTIKNATAVVLVRAAGQPGVYLVYCDDDWHVLADAWVASIAHAKAQAEREHEGISLLWADVA